MPHSKEEEQVPDLLLMLGNDSTKKVRRGLKILAKQAVFLKNPEVMSLLRRMIYELEDESRVQILIDHRKQIPILDLWLSTFEKVAVLRGKLGEGEEIKAYLVCSINEKTRNQVDQIPVPVELVPVAEYQELDLSGLYLKELHPAIQEFTSLNQLYLAENMLKSFPEVLCKMPMLEQLSLWENMITELPDGVLNMTSLRKLSLMENPIVTFPPVLFRMPQLKILVLNDCELSQLPRRIGKMTGLRELHLAGNRISSIPSELFQIPHLRLVNLKSNPLSEAPTIPADAANPGIKILTGYE